ncbi:MAG: DUF5689 domain-containing protein [Candidatus Marinimicrobia bacterium]|nr:DUF5689 domain-containing protein [Candidatus Neomarinimicrobiota bacterium]MCF7829595.1 DUF5689 domain-containing protein [Candidatus Neomarinimicrobiota bacterium]MCF7882249.1 DUF5689 domain-containing protein [Candidatus Neomarinimicrobiota bacterium]
MKTMKLGILLTVLFSLVLTVPLFAVDVTFQADISELLNEGFDPGTHNLEVRGEFNTWRTGLNLTSNGENIYSITLPVDMSAGTEVFWKFCVTPGDEFLGGEYELGANRSFVLGETATTLPVESPNLYTSVKTITDARTVGLDRVIRVQGIVTSHNFGTGFSDLTLQDANAGIFLYHGGVELPVTFRDRVQVTGRVVEYNGKLEIVPETHDNIPENAIVVLESNVTPPSPILVTIGDILESPEMYEGKLVRLDQVATIGGAWPTPGQDANMDITDAGGLPFVMRIDKETNIDETPQPEGPFDVIGVVSQFFDDYQVLPRTHEDIIRSAVQQSAWDFEEGPGNWYAFYGNANTVNSPVFDGINALGITAWQSSVPLEIKNEICPNVEPGNQFRFQVWIDNVEGISALQPYIQYGDWVWYSGWYDSENFTLTPGAWNEVIVEVPAEYVRPLKAVGLQIFRESEEYTPTVYVDGIKLDTEVAPVGLSQDVTVRFSVDVTDAVNFQTGEPFTNVQEVLLNGIISVAQWGWAPWGAIPDTTGALHMSNDGTTQGDGIAGDNIWTAEVLFPAGSKFDWGYKYGIYDNTNMDMSRPDALDNESGFGDDHGLTISDTEPLQVLPVDMWKTTTASGEYLEVPISVAQQDPAMIGRKVLVRGIVTAATGVYNQTRTFIQAEGGGPWSGILIYDNTATIQTNEGDLIAVSGTVDEYYDMTEIVVDEIELLDVNFSLPEPINLRTGDLRNPEFAEQFESVPVRLNNPVVSNPNLGNWEWEIDDGSGPCVIGVSHLKYMSPSMETVIPSITGIVDFTYGNYVVKPRDRADIEDGLTEVMIWDFEDDLQGWQSPSGIGQLDDTHPFSGNYSVRMVDNPDTSTTGIMLINNEYRNLVPNDRIQLHVWLDDTTGLQGVQVFIQFGEGFTWFHNWYNPGDLKVGAWNLIEVVVPWNYGAPLNIFGVEVLGREPDTVSPFYIDKAIVLKQSGAALVADFNVYPSVGSYPLTVQFTDMSTGDINSWYWEFGDSTTSPEQNPSHTYLEFGSYTVTLTVDGPGGSDAKRQDWCVTTFEEEYVLPVPMVNAPVIDGIADPAWESVPMTEIVHQINYGEPIDSPADLSGDFRLSWDQTNLNLFASVRDDILRTDGAESWENDGFEIFFDGDNSKGFAYDGSNDFQIIVTYGPEAPNVSVGWQTAWFDPEVITAALQNTDDGWDLEMAIPLQALGMEQYSGHQFGFEIYYEDNDTGVRDHQLLWWSEGNVWENPSVMGTAEFQRITATDTTQVTFQADITDLLSEGFDPTNQVLEVRGGFSNWQPGPELVQIEGNQYAVTIEVAGVPGWDVPWKFAVSPGDMFLDGGWELGGDRSFTFPKSDTTLAPEFPNIYTERKTLAEARALGVGRVVRSIATVTSTNFGEGYSEYAIQDSTGGLILFHRDFEYDLDARNLIQVTGRIMEYNGKLEIQPEIYDRSLLGEAVVVLNAGVPLPETQPLTIDEILAAPESFESELVRIERVAFSGDWPLEGYDANLSITDQAGAILTMRIDKETNVDGSEAPTDSFDVIGIITQFDQEAPYDDGYQILPRKRTDIFENATTVTFQADMRQLLRNGFDPDSNRIAVFGSFQDWRVGYQLFPSETDDSLYSRMVEIRVPGGTVIEWKFYAAPGGQFVNSGLETGENRIFTLETGSMVLEPMVPAIAFAEVVTQQVQYTFTVDLNNAINAQNGKPLSNVQSVFMHAFKWSPGFAVEDTSAMLRTFDDGINGGDAVAGDNIWSNQVTFVPGTYRNQQYKYAAYDPANLDFSNPYPMDNEAPPGVYHHFAIDDSQPEQALAVKWLTTTGVERHFTPAYEGNPYKAMNIYVTKATFDSLDLTAGDEIGIFDEGVCIGAGVVQGPITLMESLDMEAATDDPGTPEKDGFTPGNPLQFRLWRAAEQAEYSSPNISVVQGNEIYTSNESAVTELEFFSIMPQIVGLQSGWNIMSFAIEPVNQDMMNIAQPLVDAAQLIKVQDERGKAIEQILGTWKNNIGSWAGSEGYYLKVSEDTELEVQGFPIPLPFDVPLQAGWNIIGYPVNSPQAALNMVQPLIDEGALIKIQNESGKAIEQILGTWKDNIETFVPGEGYYLKVLADASLRIDRQTMEGPEAIAESATQPDMVAPEQFVSAFAGNPYNPMNVYVNLDDVQKNSLEAGYEIGVFDGEVCVGSVMIPEQFQSRQYLSLIAGMDDPTTEEYDGFRSGAPLSLRLWNGNEILYGAVRPLGVEPDADQLVAFEARGTAVLAVNGWQQTAIDPEMGIPTDYELANAYPNPFNPSTTIRYGVPELTDVSIQVYNMMGQRVATLVQERLHPGYYTIVWNGQNYLGQPVATGVYFYQMRTGAKVMTKKVVFMK